MEIEIKGKLEFWSWKRILRLEKAWEMNFEVRKRRVKRILKVEKN
jgi:hypothetical protein